MFGDSEPTVSSSSMSSSQQPGGGGPEPNFQRGGPQRRVRLSMKMGGETIFESGGVSTTLVKSSPRSDASGGGGFGTTNGEGGGNGAAESESEDLEEDFGDMDDAPSDNEPQG